MGLSAGRRMLAGSGCPAHASRSCKGAGMSLLEEYRQRAAEAARQAEVATSRGVRERCRHLEATWRAAAERVERSLARRHARIGAEATKLDS